MTRIRKTLVACGLALLVMTSCSEGGDDNEASPGSTTPGGPTTTLRPVETSFTGQGSGEFCTLARTYTERSATVGNAAASTPTQLRAIASEGQTAITQASNVAPPEIKADVQLISSTFSSLLAELDKVNFDATKLTPAAFAPLQAPEFGRASQRFQAYTRDVCKIPG